MSYEYYSKWWVKAKGNYEKLMNLDRKTVKGTKTIKQRSLANDLIGGLYTKYCLVLSELGVAYDQLAHPQKRQTIKKIFESAAIRLNELTTELRNIDISEYHYVDGTLIELKIIPRDVEILNNFYPPTRDQFIAELWSKIKAGETIYTPPPLPILEDEFLDEGEEGEEEGWGESEEIKPKKSKSKLRSKSVTMSGESEQPKKPKNPYEKILTPEEIEEQKRKQLKFDMIKRIQTAERARQDRLYFFDKNNAHKLKKRRMLGSSFKLVPPDPELQLKAAIIIQKYWRGFITRYHLKRREQDRRLLIKMTEPSWKNKKPCETFKKNLEKRRNLCNQRIKEYIKANLDERVRVFKVIAPGLMEDIGDEIREWFRVWYQKAEMFDTIPDEEAGGTVLVIRGETLTPEEYLENQKLKKNAKKGKGKDKAKIKAEKARAKKAAMEAKKKEKERLKKEALMKKKRLRNFNDYEYEFEPTGIKKLYDDAMEEYKSWEEIEDDPEEKHIMQIITDEKCYEMQLECRKIVDDLMRVELELLEQALAKDKKKKTKRKKKKKKKKRKKKKKGGKDLTASRTTEDLFQELVNFGIIRTYKKATLCDFIGDYSYSNWHYRNDDLDPPAALGDVKQAVKLSCILPLTTDNMKKHRSVLLVGCPQSGKKLLSSAIFTETQAVVFDLSPEVIAGKFEGGKGMKMLFHLVNKMSRILQPSIIYLPSVERNFYKKVPKDEKDLNPKRISKKLNKEIVRKIKAEDRILVLGTTSRPQLSQQGKMAKVFDRIILIPKMDYGSAMLYWRQLLMPYHGVDRNFEVTPLALLSRNYPIMCIKQTVESIMTIDRIIELKYKPLKHEEFLEYMINNCEPIPAKIWKKFENFSLKTPLGKLRKAFNKWSKAKREQMSAPKKGGGIKKR